MTAKLLVEQFFEYLSFKGGCAGLSESTLVKMPHCWKSHVGTQSLCSTINSVVLSEPSFLVHSQYNRTVFRCSYFADVLRTE